MLGEREVPVKKERSFRKRKLVDDEDHSEEDEKSGDECKNPIEFQDQKTFIKAKTKYKKSSYFSDEDELDE